MIPTKRTTPQGSLKTSLTRTKRPPAIEIRGIRGVKWRRERPLLALIAPAQDEDPEESQRVEAIDREDTEV